MTDADKTARLFDAEKKATAENEDWYARPAHGWTCYFCAETFMTPGAARDHFGAGPLTVPGCQIKIGEERGLLMALRRAEDELARYKAEDSDKDREFHAMRAKHSAELREEEQRGYDKGLADGREGVPAMAARIARLEAALKEIGDQSLAAEMHPDDAAFADFKEAYDIMITIARDALEDK